MIQSLCSGFGVFKVEVENIVKEDEFLKYNLTEAHEKPVWKIREENRRRLLEYLKKHNNTAAVNRKFQKEHDLLPDQYEGYGKKWDMSKEEQDEFMKVHDLNPEDQFRVSKAGMEIIKSDEFTIRKVRQTYDSEEDVYLKKIMGSGRMRPSYGVTKRIAFSNNCGPPGELDLIEPPFNSQKYDEELDRSNDLALKTLARVSLGLF